MFFGEALAKSENISQKVEKNNFPFLKFEMLEKEFSNEILHTFFP